MNEFNWTLFKVKKDGVKKLNIIYYYSHSTSFNLNFNFIIIFSKLK
jgi:hypothetical protein